jgi:DNA-binding MurR/RpiR family transcriptional regulator
MKLIFLAMSNKIKLILEPGRDNMIHETTKAKDILNEIIAIKEKLPKKQKRLCDYIVENYQSLGLLTVADLAKSADVGTSTVMRLMKLLGYESFYDLRKDLHEKTISSSTTWWHLKESFKISGNYESNTLSVIWEEIGGLLTRTLTGSFMDNFMKTVNLILNAKRVNILGLRTSKVVALYFEQLLEEFYPKTKQLSNESEFIYDRILQFDPEDILFVFAHAPYTNLTIEATQFCYNRGHKIILITDHLSCPITPLASAILKVEASKNQYSIVSSIALIEALVIEIGRKTSDVSIKHLEEIEKILMEKKVTRS